MKWTKQGLIYAPPHDGGWKDNSALTPTAFLLNEEVIRVYAAMRDPSGVSRIGYVDVDARDPSQVLAIAETPVLDIGRPGMFDDNGVILGDVIRVGEEIWMYYVGFQLVTKAKFLAYTGLAISTDGGYHFVRHSEAPVMDRSDEAKYIRAVHSVIYEDGVFKAWYATGNGWEKIDGKDFPQYDINYIESQDGKSFANAGVKVIENDAANNEYRIGRPRAYRDADGYIINYTYGTTDGRYQAGQARSHDGVAWRRDDAELGLSLAPEGWDSLHLSYPSVLRVPCGLTYVFYNGNNMGRDGFGYATLVGEDVV
ncbi:hypothetical protein SFA35_19940 [Pseudomonas sp. HR96]|uniref:hypothetical protein n=1 Tax=Pseudomonas sp. HR96 TaxID=1027966 RepID=UPI002A75E692|nr:hypothetical protein [Pseudomonas sp. HR96]WPO98869.1 hypothetical protein SFA35_19940 [Pseudomonas sp. HR96]